MMRACVETVEILSPLEASDPSDPLDQLNPREVPQHSSTSSHLLSVESAGGGQADCCEFCFREVLGWSQRASSKVSESARKGRKVPEGLPDHCPKLRLLGTNIIAKYKWLTEIVKVVAGDQNNCKSRCRGAKYLQKPFPVSKILVKSRCRVTKIIVKAVAGWQNNCKSRCREGKYW